MPALAALDQLHTAAAVMRSHAVERVTNITDSSITKEMREFLRRHRLLGGEQRRLDCAGQLIHGRPPSGDEAARRSRPASQVEGLQLVQVVEVLGDDGLPLRRPLGLESEAGAGIKSVVGLRDLSYENLHRLQEHEHR